ncbi:MAG: hypothetical protein AAGC44_02825 [Planctomycetota bacterium]
MDFRTFNEEPENTGQPEGEESSSMLSTIGGDTQPEGEPLGMDGLETKAKISTSTLAIGLVVVLGAAVLFGMKLTLGVAATDEQTQAAIQDIEKFMIEMAAAEEQSAQGPLKSPTAESEKVFAQLKQDPTDHQVPSEQVEKNPFELVGIVRDQPEEDDPQPTGPTAEQILDAEKQLAKQLTVNTIMNGNNPMAFINNEMYRVGAQIDDSIFVVHEIEQRSVIIRSVESGNLIRLPYD